MQEITVTPLEALYRLIGAASMIDSAECKDEAIYNTLQGELTVAKEVAKALAMAPKQEAPRQWVAIKDSTWVNIVNHDHVYEGWDKDDIINHVFKLTEAKCKELNGPYAAPAAANGALTDEQILTIIWKYSSFISVGNYSSTQFDCQTDMLNCIRAILAAAGPDAALVKALEGTLAVIDDYLAYTHDGDPWKEDARAMGEMDINDADNDGRIESWRAALSGAKGN